MSDSDDTDILLLIPPNYFIASAEDQLREEELRNRHHYHHYHQQHQYHHCSMERKNEMPADYEDMPAPTAAYQFLHPSKKVELNSINARLHSLNTLEREERGDHHFAAPSDISTISNSTVRTQFGGNNRQQHAAFVHSTPKCPPLKDNRNVQLHDKDGMLLEIDHFLEEDQHYNGNGNGHANWRHYSDDYGKPASLEHLGGMGPTSTELQATSLPCTLNSLPLSSRQQQPPDSNLISLSEIWGKSGQATAIQVPNNQNALREEQLRRQHLEKTIRALQGRLLEYQQRLSVAIEVDRAKDTALQNAQHEAKSLNQELQQLRETNSLLERQRREHSGKMDALQLELTHAVNLATKFQEKNDKLEQELSTHTKKTNECSQLYKQQLEELELKVHGYKKSEELALNENAKLRDRLAKAEYQSEKLKLRCDDLEKDNSALKNQKEMLQEFHQKQKSRAEALETQKKSLQETLQHLTENESSLKRKLESQQKALKSHYQQQLENVVSQKLKEFQLQLDKTEETLKQEARERERLIAERSVKQLELINEKNELELNLMAEKYNEEVELYRIQLANASKKIDDLEAKLNFYKYKRADIAEKLHNVMEMQWQKALEILTSPQQQHSRGSQAYDDNDHVSTECNENNELMETPKTTKTSNQQKPNIKENNFNVPSSKETAVPMDKLQAYIELLLSKSPADFEKLDEILSLTSKHKSANGHSSSKLDKSLGAKRNSAHLKPPWKA